MLFRFLALGALAVTQGYVLGAPAAVTASRAAVSMHFPPINESVDKGNPKVVTTVKCEDIKGKGVYCRCWRSKTFPNCDASHVKWNEERGDNVGPLIVMAAKPAE